ncbi:MAG: hypothetical protein COS89_06645 [Deltaproteobacteria bacterium CG07_land_8_20_14_0_80_38_7]|nr:MAG: hypothetical protein COS89_06645 [Deltaproteobacteria bacterium CG07_land_8_20_14_0_80_38_7]
MKKVLLLAVVFALVPLVVSASTPTCTNATFTGKVVESISPDLKGKPVEVVMQQVGNKCVRNAKIGNDTEEWTTIDDKTLVQKEFGPDGKVATTYTALYENGKYNIKCDAARKNCDAGIDSRNNWTLTLSPDTNTFTYTVYGVDSAKKADPNAPILKRHEFVLHKKQ